MSVFEHTIGIFLLAAGLAICVVLIAPLIVSLSRAARGYSQASRLKKAKARLQEIDDVLEENQFGEASSLIRDAFILDPGLSRENILVIREHNENVLSRCVIVAEGFGVHIENIADIERSIIERSELQLALLRASSSFQKLREKRNKQLPDWTKHDYEKRMAEISAGLDQNRTELRTSLERLFGSLSKQSVPEVFYH